MANKTVKFSILVTDDGTMKQVEVNAEDLQEALGGIDKSSTKAKSSVSSLGGVLKKYLAVGAIVAGLKKAVDTIANFERANSELASVLGTTLSGVQELSKSAEELGRTTEFTASEVTSLQTALARLGFNSGQIRDMQEPVLKFAAAVGTDLASAADFAGSALRSFGLKSSDTQELLDIMALSTSASALSFSKLQTSISTVGPVANAFGLKASEVTSLLGVLSNAGFDASTAATALRNILLNLADSNGKLASGLGYSAKTMPEIIGALKDLRDKGVDLNSTLAMTDKRSVAAFNALIKGASSVETLNGILSDTDGALNTMYGTMTDNVIGATRALESAWEGFVLKFQASKGPIADVCNFAANQLNALSDSLDRRANKNSLGNATEQGQSLMGRMWGSSIGNEAGTAEQQDAILGDINAQIKAAEDAIESKSASLEKTVGNVQKRMGRKELEQLQFNLQMLQAAREDFFNRQKYYSGSYYESDAANPTPDETPENLIGSTDDFAAYRKAVNAAVEVNRVFAGGVNTVGVQLNTMRQGITSLIAKYGAEDARVKALVTEYRQISKARMMETPLQKADTSFVDTGLSAGISDAIAEYRRNVESAVKMNSIFGQSGTVMDTRLSAMKDGLLDLIKTYGLYNTEIQKLIEEYKLLNKSGESYETTSRKVNGSGNTTVEVFSGMSNVFTAMNGLVGESAKSWTSWVATLLGSVAQAIPSIMTLIAAIHAKTTAEIGDAAAGGAAAVAGVPLVGPGMAVAASATILASILGAISSIPKFAGGGIAYGPTLGLFGEYAGASSNPEVVAPLDKLRDLIGSTEDSGPRVPVKFRIEGRDLVAIADIERNRQKRVG